jgi:hypothetical protein
MRSSEEFRTSHPLLSIVAVRETASTIQALWVLFIIVCIRDDQLWRSLSPKNHSLYFLFVSSNPKSCRRILLNLEFSGLLPFLFLSLINTVFVIRTYSHHSFRCSNMITGPVTSGLTEYLVFEDTRRCEWLQRHWTEWRLIGTVAETVRFTEAASLFAELRGKSHGLKLFLSQGKRPVSWNTKAIITPIAANLYAFPNSSPIW